MVFRNKNGGVIRRRYVPGGVAQKKQFRKKSIDVERNNENRKGSFKRIRGRNQKNIDRSERGNKIKGRKLIKKNHQKQGPKEKD